MLSGFFMHVIKVGVTMRGRFEIKLGKVKLKIEG
jgi:hypothetical protein